jgi:hypothetical protein
MFDVRWGSLGATFCMVRGVGLAGPMQPQRWEDPMGRRMEPDVVALRAIKAAVADLPLSEAMRVLKYAWDEVVDQPADWIEPGEEPVTAQLARCEMALEALSMTAGNMYSSDVKKIADRGLGRKGWSS